MSYFQHNKKTNRIENRLRFLKFSFFKNTLSFPEMKGTLVVLLWTDCDSFVHGAPLIEDNNRNVSLLLLLLF